MKNQDQPADTMTKRELLAAMAMQGLCTQATAAYEKGPCDSAIVARAVILADALLAELDKENVCEWRATEDGRWETSCRNCFEFTTAGPTENKFAHCPYCGRKIKEVK